MAGGKSIIKFDFPKLNVCILRPRVVIGPGKLGIFQVFLKEFYKIKIFT